MRPVTRLAATSIVLAGLALPTAAHADNGDSPTTDTQAAGDSKIMLLLDGSGSMYDKAGNTTRIEAARSAMHDVIDGLPDDAQVGLRVYGDKVDGGGKPTPKACKDTRLAVPVGTDNREDLGKAVDDMKPLGETPIALSLQKAAEDLGEGDNRRIILVSDGEESCDPDPCKTVEKLKDDGIDVQIDTVGLGVGGAAREELQCFASATGGSYYDAKDADELSSALTRLSSRANRPFSLTGEQVQGSLDEKQAPMLETGQYRDTVRANDDALYYRIKRSKGATISFNVTGRPWFDWDDDDAASSDRAEALNVEMLTPQGDSCIKKNGHRFDVFRSNTVMSTTAILDGHETRRSGYQSDECESANEFIVKVERDADEDAKPMPVELVVNEEPGVSDVNGLPTAAKASDIERKEAPPQRGKGEPVVGGGAFSDAAEVKDGQYADTIMVGEELFYKVKLDWGQQAAVSIDAWDPNADWKPDGKYYLKTQHFGPDRQRMHTSGNPSALIYKESTDPVTMHSYTAPVRYMNRDGELDGDLSLDTLRGSARDGYYYFSINAGSQGSPQEEGRQAMPLRIRVAVSDEGGTAPTYDQSSDAQDQSTGSGQFTDPSDGSTEGGEGNGESTEPGGDAPQGDENGQEAQPHPLGQLILAWVKSLFSGGR